MKNRSFDNFVFLSPFPFLTMLRNNEQNLPQPMLSAGNIVQRERGGVLNTLFKILIIFCHWLSKIYKKKKNAEVWCLLLRITHKLPQYYFYAIIIWKLSEKCHFKHTMNDAVVWLSCYPYIFAILTYFTTTNQCLTMSFSQNLCVIGKIFIRWYEKKHQAIEKLDMSKIPTVNPLF